MGVIVLVFIEKGGKPAKYGLMHRLSAGGEGRKLGYLSSCLSLIKDCFWSVSSLTDLTAPCTGFAVWKGQRTFSGRETQEAMDIFGNSVGHPQVRLKRHERGKGTHSIC